ncbi:HD domain-containing protein [Thermomonospora catenispora]|uniref:HD domain-containing protein n=1 Tax=Thermomonospora catenispora TaxID=2493090 RepID=UPI00112063B0|nr:HD domain-containing protein [Thermomonospora catenispora]TNY37287.1 HD domain-containing protein [Thermomonospora catenispora]
MTEELKRLAGFLHEIGLLKRYKRTGWLVAGVTDPESVADHSMRTAVIAAVLAALEGADPARAALLALFHDSQETRLTDLPHLSRPYVEKTPNEKVTADQTRGLPEPVAAMITAAVAEYEGRDSREAICARDADKLECLLQALEYREQGNRNTGPWIDSSLADLRTASATRLAEEALATGTLEWLTRALNDPDAR